MIPLPIRLSTTCLPARASLNADPKFVYIADDDAHAADARVPLPSHQRLTRAWCVYYETKKTFALYGFTDLYRAIRSLGMWVARR